MKKYLAVASLFAINLDVISWCVLCILVVMAVVDFAKAVDREREGR